MARGTKIVWYHGLLLYGPWGWDGDAEMTSDVVLPLWLFVLLCGVALLALLDRLFIPSVRWFIRRRVNRAIDEVSTRLRISLRPFQLTKRQVLLDRLVYDTEVIKAMQAYAEAEGMPREVAQSRVTEYAREIVPAFNAYLYFRFGYWLSKKFARLLYSVRFGFLDDRRLEDVDPESTVVFVMNHRSNMDYFLVSYLVSQQSTLSYAVGEWARVWPIQMMLRAMGAFFVRRDSGDALYRKVLERYVHMATEEGVCQAVFPEGGLSHDGLPRAPRLGLLDYMLRSYGSSSPRDIVFIPVGINYDRVLEDTNLLHRRTPGAKKRGTWYFIKVTFGFYRESLALSVPERRKRFGYAGVNFGRPISVRAFCAEHGIAFNELPRNQRFEHIATLADELMTSITHIIPILPVSLVATVFRRSQGGGMNSIEIKKRVLDLVRECQERGAPIKDSEMPRENTIMAAVEVLLYRKVLREGDGWYHCESSAAELLDFYANSIAHWTHDAVHQPSPEEQVRAAEIARALREASS